MRLTDLWETFIRRPLGQGANAVRAEETPVTSTKRLVDAARAYRAIDPDTIIDAYDWVIQTRNKIALSGGATNDEVEMYFNRMVRTLKQEIQSGAIQTHALREKGLRKNLERAVNAVTEFGSSYKTEIYVRTGDLLDVLKKDPLPGPYLDALERGRLKLYEPRRGLDFVMPALQKLNEMAKPFCPCAFAYAAEQPAAGACCQP